MRAVRVGFLPLAAAMALASAGTASAAATKPTFKITISPQFATAGEQTTFQVTVANTSSRGTTLGSVQVTPPSGFTLEHPTTSQRKTRVQGRTLVKRQLAIKPGAKLKFTVTVTATAPSQDGRLTLRWTAHAFTGGASSGPQLALQRASSSLGVTVLPPASAPCGDGGPPCSTGLVTSNSTYTVVSDAPAGTLRQTVNVGNRLVCGNYRFRDPNWYDSGVIPPATAPPPPAAAPIVDQVTYLIKNATAKGIGFCLGAGYEFTTASGAQARAGTLPTGNPGFIGLLPMCSTSKAPCITSVVQLRDRKAKVGFDVSMQVQIPENGDPWGHG